MAEFGLLVGLALLAYGLQETVAQVIGQILAVPLYLVYAVFFWLRGPALAEAQAPLTAAVLGANAGRASAAVYGALFRVMGIAALALIPVAIIWYLVES